MGVLPSGTTTAVPEWLPRHVFAGVSASPAAGESRLSEMRRLTAGLDVKQTSFDRAGEALFFVATPRGSARGALYRVELGRASAGGLERAAERLSAESEDVTALAMHEDRVFYRTAAGGWAERVDGSARPVDLPKAEFLAFSSGEPIALGGAEGGDAAVRTVSFPILEAKPSGRQAALSSPASWSGPFAGLAPAVSPSGATVALGLPDPACVRTEAAPAKTAAGRSAAARPSECDAARSVSLFSREGRGKRQVVDVAPHRIESVAFMTGSSSEDEELCFASDRDRSNLELYSVSTKNRSVERLTFAGGRAPSVSLSSGRIAFASHRAGDSADLFVANLGPSSGLRETP